jgi:hypothetical protein
MSFMVSDDLLSSVEELPTKLHESKMWEPTKVVDYDRLPNFKWHMVEDWPRLSQEARAEFIFYLIIRYIAGIGDLADRNFLVIGDRVYGLDEDAPNKGVLGQPGRMLKKQRSQLIVSWLSIDANWTLLSRLLKQMEEQPIPANLFKNSVNTKDRIEIIRLFLEDV